LRQTVEILGREIDRRDERLDDVVDAAEQIAPRPRNIVELAAPRQFAGLNRLRQSVRFVRHEPNFRLHSAQRVDQFADFILSVDANLGREAAAGNRIRERDALRQRLQHSHGHNADHQQERERERGQRGKRHGRISNLLRDALLHGFGRLRHFLIQRA